MKKYVDVEKLIEKFEDVTWYHMNSEEHITEGADNEFEALFFAKDIFDTVREMPVVLAREPFKKGSKHLHWYNVFYNWFKSIFCKPVRYERDE